jgi:fermentation-respiration switch protein FrsA (DUF1100 family)
VIVYHNRITAHFHTQLNFSLAKVLSITREFKIKNGHHGKSQSTIVGHPMGAVKEQSANLYAAKMAEKGFVTLSFWGESEGQPRNAVLPNLYAEDFSAAVDFLSTRSFVDRGGIGVIGICGSGGFAISAAKIDPRMKAIDTVSMYKIWEMLSATHSAIL